MKFLSYLLLNSTFSKRLRQLESLEALSIIEQDATLHRLLKRGRNTEYGREHHFSNISSYDQFARMLPVSDYNQLKPYILRMLEGERNILCSERVKWFAKSSGTTEDKSKFLPLTHTAIKECHQRGSLDVLAIYHRQNPKGKILSGRTLTLGGSKALVPNGKTWTGDLSAILIHTTPLLIDMLRSPDKKTALIEDFQKKVEQIALLATKQKITALAGVPSWMLVLLNFLLDYTKKENVLEIWQDLELFIHGGINFSPYVEQYQKIIPSNRMTYINVYNASEGFFAIQDQPKQPHIMRLMTDYNVFYEFIDMAHFGTEKASCVPLEGVKVGKNYAIVITTSSGLWRYIIGDTVRFVSTAPYRIEITGRTSYYINAFGEEVIEDNAIKALEYACQQTGAEVSEFTAGPIFMEGKTKGAHQWIVEFSTKPKDVEKFIDCLDYGLQKQNSDYEAKRTNNFTLERLKLTVVASGTFRSWLSSQGKEGGQNKVPRLANDRKHLNSLLSFIDNSS